MLSFSSITTTCQTNQPTTTDDYTPIKNSKLQAAAKLIEVGKINAQLVVLLNQKVDSLNQRIGFLQAAIKGYAEKDTAVQHVIDTYKTEVANLISQRDMATKEMNTQNKLYRRQKRKTVFTTLASAGITSAIFLYLKSK